jgi:hypothetical protein
MPNITLIELSVGLLCIFRGSVLGMRTSFVSGQKQGAFLEDFPTMFFLVVLVVGLILFTGAIQELEINNVWKDFAREVDLTKVPVKGKSISSAKILITYEDGSLSSVKLAKGTAGE